MNKIQPKDIDDDLFCYFDRTGKLPTEWQQVTYFDEDTDLAIVSINNVHGAINRDGEVVIPIKYDYAMVRFGEGLLPVMKENKWGYVDANNKIVIPFEYENLVDYRLESGEFWKNKNSNLGTADYFSDNKALVRKNGKLGIINKQNEILIPFEYDNINSWSKELITVSKSGKFGAVNWNNEVIIPFCYDELLSIFENKTMCFGIKTDEKIINYDIENRQLLNFKDDSLLKYGIIDFEKNVIVPPISYLPIRNFSNGKAMCFDYQKDEFYVYDVKTKELTFAPENYDENKKVNFVREKIGLTKIQF